MVLRVRNWEEFQHYKDRCPPWIKLHFALLTSEDWVLWDDASRVLAVACMLLASRNNGEIPANPGYIRRVAYLNCEPNFKPLIDCGFLVYDDVLADASNLLAICTTEERREDTEKETEGETDRPKRKRFVPPTLAEVESFISENKLRVDAADFIDFYQSKDWMVGKSKMKDWHASCRRAEKWESNLRKFSGKTTRSAWADQFDAQGNPL